MAAQDTILKLRGKLNAVIELAREQGVPDAVIAERIVKAARAEYGQDAGRVLEQVWKAEKAAHDAGLFRPGATHAATVMGKAHPAGIGAKLVTEFATPEQSTATRKSDQRKRDEAKASYTDGIETFRANNPHLYKEKNS